mmetsp:Transcript_72239/g.211682  ORF Transcript_72239/g.211682 Transcript_72239/m.211682 type:complete len:120 (+) Transcript_72239:1264-1623(+)
MGIPVCKRLCKYCHRLFEGPFPFAFLLQSVQPIVCVPDFTLLKASMLSRCDCLGKSFCVSATHCTCQDIFGLFASCLALRILCFLLHLFSTKTSSLECLYKALTLQWLQVQKLCKFIHN